MEEKNKGGRPPYNFKPILKLGEETIIGWFSKGMSLVGFLAKLHKSSGIYLPKSTMYDVLKRVDQGNGTEDEQKFSDILNIGRLYSQDWWEEEGRKNLIGTKEGGTLNAGVYNKMISHRFPDDYKDKEKGIKIESDTESGTTTIEIGGEEY